MSFPRYPEYKDSGVEWLGEVPTHWRVLPTKRGFTRLKELNTGMTCENRLALTMAGVVPRSLDDLEGLQASEFESYQIFEPNDLAFKLIDLQNIKTSRVGLVPELGIMSPAYIRLEPHPSVVNPKFAYWFFTDLYNRLIFNQLGGGVRQTIGHEELLTLAFLFVPLSEQRAVAAFLDRETAKIDALVAEQERLIELLKEKRQAVISHAVTKGLDPTVPMKDSGIEWLGEVPAHWEVRRLRHVVPEITVGIVVEPSKYYTDEGIPALRSLNVKPGRIIQENLVFISQDGHALHTKSRLRTGDLVAVRSGQPGTTAVIPPELHGANCIDLIIIRKPLHGSERYLSWYMASDVAIRQFTEGSGGAIQQHFNVGTATNMIVALPPEDEQLGIANFLDQEALMFDALIDEAQHAIDLLKERRGALISAAVTGKIDVRDQHG